MGLSLAEEREAEGHWVRQAERGRQELNGELLSLVLGIELESSHLRQALYHCAIPLALFSFHFETKSKLSRLA